MNNKYLPLAVALLLICLQAGTARAAVLSLEPAATVAAPGESIALNLLVSGLGNFGPSSLGAFDVNIGFDTAALAFTGYDLGLMLGDISLFEALDASGGVAGASVNLAEVSLLDSAALHALQPGEFQLATLYFEIVELAAGEMTELFFLPDALLANAEGQALPVTQVVSAFVEGRVPAPATLGLLLIALAAFARTRKSPNL